MKIIFPRAVLAASLAALCLVACNKEKAPATGGKAASPDMPPDTVVATIGNEKITAGQLDKEVGPQLKQMEDQFQKQKFDLRKQRLDQMVMEKLVKAEAAKKGQTEEEFYKAEIDAKVAQPSDEQINKLFEESKARLPPGSTVETYRGQIVDFLTRNQKQEKARELFERLRKENNVSVKLTEPRKQVEASGPARGRADAKVTIVEFSDFECPFCSRAHDVVEQVMQQYAGKVKLTFRHYPLPFHPNAQKAAEASMCAHDQGKFWEYHDVLFQNREALGVDSLKKYAADLKLDTAKFNQCLDGNTKADLVKADFEAGGKVGVNGTPAFFINGIMISGAQPIEEFKRIIDQELAGS